jgi:hypothetical protein
MEGDCEYRQLVLSAHSHSERYSKREQTTHSYNFSTPPSTKMANLYDPMS